MDGRLQHTVIDDTNTPAQGPRSYSAIKIKKGEFILSEELDSFRVGDGTTKYEDIPENNIFYAGKGAGSAYKFKLNGTTYPSGTLPEYTKDLSNNGIYAPLSGGNGNQVLISLGDNIAPAWANVNISDGLGIINTVGDTYNLILRASSSGHLGGVYSDYSNLFLNNYRVLSSGQSNTDPNYPEVTIFAPTTSTTLASGASISNQLLISQADNQAPIWTGLTLNGSTNGKYLKWDNGWTLDNAGGGTNAYVHIKYANSSNPQDSDMHNIPAVGDKYIGVYSGSASVAPTDHASYVWSKYVGEDGTGVAIKANAESCTQLGDGYIDQNQSSTTYGHLMVLTSLSPRTFADAGEIKGPAGDQGIQGPSGANGNSIFLRYSASSSGNPMHTSFQQGDKYIGIYTGQAASANYQDYTWCKFIGDDGSTVGDTWRAIKVNGTEKLGTNPASSGNGPIDFKPGNHISISFNSTGNTLNIAHSDTSTQASVSNSGRTYIQSIELDDDGHVTNLASHTETVTNTDRYVNNAAFADDTTNNSSSPVKMTLTRAGSDSATVTANIPKISSTSAGVVPKGNVVSSQTQSTKFLREDGEWHAPSYTTGGTTVQQRQHATANELYPILCTETSTQTSPTDLTTVGYNNKVKLSKTNIIIEQAGTNPTKKYEYGGSSPITVYNNNNQVQKGVIISGGIAAATISNTYLKWDGTNFVWDNAGAPSSYLSNASISGSTLTITKSNGTTVEFTDTDTHYTTSLLLNYNNGSGTTKLEVADNTSHSGYGVNFLGGNGISITSAATGASTNGSITIGCNVLTTNYEYTDIEPEVFIPVYVDKAGRLVVPLNYALAKAGELIK